MMREISVRVAIFTAGIFGILVGAVCASGCGGTTTKVKAEVEPNPAVTQRPDEIEIKNIIAIERTETAYSVYTYDEASKKMRRYQLRAAGAHEEIIICDVEKGAPMWAKQTYKKDGQPLCTFELHVRNPQDIIDAKRR